MQPRTPTTPATDSPNPNLTISSTSAPPSSTIASLSTPIHQGPVDSPLKFEKQSILPPSLGYEQSFTTRERKRNPSYPISLFSKHKKIHKGATDDNYSPPPSAPPTPVDNQTRAQQPTGTPTSPALFSPASDIADEVSSLQITAPHSTP